MDFKTLIKKPTVILDGAIGTELQKLCKLQNVNFQIPETLNFTHPEIVKTVIRNYAISGSDMVCANTFGANRFKMQKSGKSVSETIAVALRIAKEAVEDFPDILVGLDSSTIGRLLEPTGTLPFEEAYDIFSEIMKAAEEFSADFILIETMTDLYEMKAAFLAAKENTTLPIICSMTFEKNGRTFTGCSPAALALTLEGLGADAIGVNCSLGPVELLPIVEEISKVTSLPIMVKPNAGLPDPETGTFSLNAEDFVAHMLEYAKKGVKFLGGCCGTTPEFIKKLKNELSDRESEIQPKSLTVPYLSPGICGFSDALFIDRPFIIGERINPTGKKMFKQALLDNNIDYILKQAIEQVSAGAEILDVNVGLPEIDEKKMMVRVIKAIQSVTDVPLQIDSTNPAVIEAALRIYNGKPIVNSVNGEPETWNTIFPLIKKYGAAVLGLTLDKNGIPPKAEERFKIAEKILAAALSYGIPRSNIFIDCLTLTVSAEQESAMETLKAVKMVKERLNLKTVLGVSNISFGLPNREMINQTFLAAALEKGLDLPIINPNIDAMTGTVRAYRILSGVDKNSMEFLAAYSEKSSLTKEPKSNSNLTLKDAVLKGLSGEAQEITKKRLIGMPALDIVEKELIPALDKVGSLFEQGKLFLPQLILSADVAGSCFEIIKKDLIDKGVTPEFKGKIIVATVRGDIHDIGKNIVKILLGNYGYHVIDLGKDVDENIIVETAINQSIKLVGLSALMTTTLPAMANTIKLLREKCPQCKVMVGGAVLTKDYAEKIGADFYANDAQGSINIARQVFG